MPPSFRIMLLEKEFKDETMLFYQYINQDRLIDIQKNSIETTVDFDYREDNYETIERNGVTYLVSFADEDICNVIWNVNNYYYQVSSNIEKEEILKIAFCVQ